MFLVQEGYSFIDSSIDQKNDKAEVTSMRGNKVVILKWPLLYL